MTTLMSPFPAPECDTKSIRFHRKIPFKIPPLLRSSKSSVRQWEFPRLTSGVDVKVGGLVGHVPHGVQAGPAGVHLAGVAQSFGYVHRVGTLVGVLTSKQHFHLRRKKEETLRRRPTPGPSPG